MKPTTDTVEQDSKTTSVEIDEWKAVNMARIQLGEKSLKSLINKALHEYIERHIDESEV